MTTKTILCATALLVAAFPAMALPLGACHAPADARAKLAAEGHKVTTTSADQKTWMSLGPKDSGYVLQADAGGSMCVVSILRSVTTIKSLGSDDLCDDPARYPGAAAACQLAKANGLPVKTSVSAEASKSALSDKMDGPVNTTIVICADKSGREVLCGRTETLQSGTGKPAPK